jgi:uncharacterized membrane protein
VTTPKLSLPAISHLGPNVQGIYFLIAGMVVLSLQNIAVRAIDERYAVLGLIWAIGMYCVAQAYRLTQASVAAPFEYTALPINVMWGYLLWQEIPTLTTWLGAILTIACGLYIFYRDNLTGIRSQELGH